MSKALPTIPGRRAALAMLTREERDFARQWGDVPALPLTTAKAPRFTMPRINLERAALAFLLAVACGSGAMLAVMHSPAPVARIIAETTTGDSYVAGEGDTCAAAAQQAQFPAAPLAFVSCVIEGAR